MKNGLVTALCSKGRLKTQDKLLLPAVNVLSFALAVMVTQAMGRMPLMTASWNGFKTSMTNFFENGLGGPGMEGIGIVIAVAGLVSAAISFAVHKFNPQSRMPGWISCLFIGLVGAIAMGGVAKPLKVLAQGRNLIYGWFGL